MKASIAVLFLTLSVWCVPGRAQTAQNTTPHKAQPTIALDNSGPLAWITSDVNSKTVFWIQGRWVPVDNVEDKGPADVGTILCSVREQECLEIDSTSPMPHGVQTWIEEYRTVNWDKDGILATGRSLDGCTDETLKVHFSPPSAVIINSPVLPMSEHCKKFNDSWDKLAGKKGSTIAGQTEQDELVPTRTLFPWADVDLDTGKVPIPVQQKNP
ncbi:MAG: hypothetical protein ABSE53_17150 [Terracidiphilus sp.]|jgi:hypothetical protein